MLKWYFEYAGPYIKYIKINFTNFTFLMRKFEIIYVAGIVFLLDSSGLEYY